jgi:hypothetical protein
MTTVISFDVGVRNLAYAVLEVGDDSKVSLTRWDLIDLESYGKSKEGTEDAIGSVIRALDDSELTSIGDVVLIENQPCMKNPKMKTVQVAIHAFFAMHDHYSGDLRDKKIKIRLVNPRNKVGIIGSYSGRKRESIIRCREFLDRELVDGDGQVSMTREQAVSRLERANKKDDLADAFMQAIWYVKSLRAP